MAHPPKVYYLCTVQFKKNIVMKSKLSTVAIVLSSLSVAVSIAALCIALPRAHVLDVDYLGLLVGILALLVTVLIGWNIYSVMDIKRIQADVQNIQLDTYAKIQQTSAIVSHSLSDFYYRLLVGAKPLGDDFNFVYYRVSEIYHLSLVGDYKFCEALISSLIEVFPDPKQRKFRKEQMKNLWSLVSRIQGQHQIPNFSDLMVLLTQMSDEV